MRGLAALALILAAYPASAETASPGQLAEGLVSAWNTHDLKAFEALYAPNAIWVPVAEERTIGRESIIREFAKVHTGNGWAVGTTMALKGRPQVQMIRPDVANVFFHVDFLSDGKPVPGIQRALILVAVAEHRKWRIAAGQLTKESPPPE